MTDLDELMARAESAAAPMRRATDAERAGWLVALADRIDAAADELVVIADEETGLGEGRLRGEIARTTSQLRMFAAVVVEGSYLEATIDHAVPEAAPPRPDLRRVLRPLGPVAVFAASNFPFAFSVVGGDTASALAVGCPVVVKAHPGHPRLSRRTAELAREALEAAGAPPGAFAVVEGFAAGLELVDHAVTTAVAFTGSLAGGRALHDRAASRPVPIPFFGELGSINPVVVTAHADATRGEELAAGLAASFQLGSGQFCTKPGVVFVPEGSVLESALLDGVVSERPRMLTPSIAEGFAHGTARIRSLPGVAVLTAGSAGAPVVVATDTTTLGAYRDELLAEVFGPFTLLVRYRSRDELRIALEALEGSLTATLHAAPGEPVDDVLPRLEAIAGRVLFAGWPTGVAVTWSQHHGGPWPATTSQHTSVGATAVRRFLRPIVYQDAPQEVLPPALRDGNPLGIPRRVDGVLQSV